VGRSFQEISTTNCGESHLRASPSANIDTRPALDAFTPLTRLSVALYFAAALIIISAAAAVPPLLDSERLQFAWQ
jgi:hypothetical protein